MSERLWLDHIKPRAFPREFGNPYRKLVTNSRDYVSLIRGAKARDCYISVYPYQEDFVEGYEHRRKPYEETVIIDTIYLDFDYERDPLLALEDARMIPERANAWPRTYFSGNKGFHVFIDIPPIELENPRETLKRYCEGIAGGLETLDKKIMGDISRISRIPATINSRSKGSWGEELHCVPLTEVEFHEISSRDDIREIAKHSPEGRRIRREPSEEVAEELREIDSQVGDRARMKKLVSEILDIKGIRPKLSITAQNLIDSAHVFKDGRRRILAFLLIPRLKHLSDRVIRERCREFIESSGKKWSEYRGYVESNIRRTRRDDWKPWQVKTFLFEDGNKDLQKYFAEMGCVNNE